MNHRTIRLVTIAVLLVLLAGVQPPGRAAGQTGMRPRRFLPVVWQAYAPEFVPREPPSLTRLDGTDNSTCLVTRAGEVKCWGDSFTALQNDVLYPSKNRPVTIPGLSGVKSVAVGYDHACALLNDGAVQCWGGNVWGQLGNGGTDDSLTPVDVMGLNGRVKAVAAGEYFSCALLEHGEVQCWGDAWWGQLGTGIAYGDIDSFVPYAVTVRGLASRVSSLAVGYRHACAVRDGSLWCWGSSEYSQTGTRCTDDRCLEPVRLNDSRRMFAVFGGGNAACAAPAGGGLKCWGDNQFGQVGNGTAGNIVDAPFWTMGPSSIVNSASAAKGTTCAVMLDGSARCWGYNADGQVGNRAPGTNVVKPVDVVGLTDAAEIATGDNHTCALLFDGSVVCWGDNSLGQLGNGSNQDSLVPVLVEGL